MPARLRGERDSVLFRPLAIIPRLVDQMGPSYTDIRNRTRAVPSILHIRRNGTIIATRYRLGSQMFNPSE